MISLTSYVIENGKIFLNIENAKFNKVFYRGKEVTKINDGVYELDYDSSTLSFDYLYTLTYSFKKLPINIDAEPLIGSTTVLNPARREGMSRETIFNLAKNNVVYADDACLRCHSCIVMTYMALELCNDGFVREAMMLCQDTLAISNQVGFSESIKRNRYHLKTSIFFVMLLCSIYMSDRVLVNSVVDNVFEHFHVMNEEYSYKETIYNINRMLLIISCLQIKGVVTRSEALDFSIKMTSKSIANFESSSNAIVFSEMINSVEILGEHKKLYDGSLSIENGLLLSCRLVGTEQKKMFVEKFIRM